jgi:hypothetical protein
LEVKRCIPHLNIRSFVIDSSFPGLSQVEGEFRNSSFTTHPTPTPPPQIPGTTPTTPPPAIHFDRSA